MVRTRFAPSPNGNMHIGNLKNALFAYLLACKKDGKFILRLEDTNQEKYSTESEELIYKILNIFNFKIDEGPEQSGYFRPYIQSERLDIYKKYAEYLVKNDYAYYCFCNEDDLAKRRMDAVSNKKSYMYDRCCRDLTKEEVNEKLSSIKKYCIRQKMPLEGTTSYKDEIFGNITIDNKTLEDQVLLKSDGYPTYNFASALDDALMQITDVTVGREYLINTTKSVILYDYLNFDIPKFYHLPHIIKNNNEKFSKEKKEDNIMELLKKGYLPEAIINYVALLGWSPKSNKEIFSLDELINEFDEKNIKKDDCYYDINKLNWYNRQYLKKMSDDKYVEYALNILKHHILIDNKQLINTIVLKYRQSINNIYELVDIIKIYIDKEVSYSSDCAPILKNISNIKEIVIDFHNEIKSKENLDKETINSIIINLKNKYGSDVYPVIRIAITGKKDGIDLVDTILLLGKTKIIERLS